jgi:hypothetical protein
LRSCEPNRVCPTTSEVLQLDFQDPVGLCQKAPHVASDLTVVQDARAVSVEKPVARSLFKDSSPSSLDTFQTVFEWLEDVCATSAGSPSVASELSKLLRLLLPSLERIGNILLPAGERCWTDCKSQSTISHCVPGSKSDV